MNLYLSEKYMEDVRDVASLDLPWGKLASTTMVLSGSTGLLGSFLIDVILEKNITEGLNCTVYALGRNEQKFKTRFSKYNNDQHLIFISYDVNTPLAKDDIGTVDYVLHLASNTHPMQYSTDPIGTITANIIGLQNMLNFGLEHQVQRFVFASSNEIYGENRGDVEFFDEAYCGFINCNTLRAGYPESKRCGETLCQAYIFQKNLDIVIPRFTRSYGPTMLMTDTKAISQFIKKGIAGEDIILKSPGMQYYSYTYVSDAISGLLTVLLKGKKGEAYNIADKDSDIRLKNLASLVARICGKELHYEIPDAIESAGYSAATKARLSGHKLRRLGWKPKYCIESGMHRTIDILRNSRENGKDIDYCSCL